MEDVPLPVGPFAVLAPQEWRCVWFRARYGYTHQELGARIGTKPSAAVSYLKRAVWKLQLSSIYDLTPLVWDHYYTPGTPDVA